MSASVSVRTPPAATPPGLTRVARGALVAALGLPGLLGLAAAASTAAPMTADAAESATAARPATAATPAPLGTDPASRPPPAAAPIVSPTGSSAALSSAALPPAAPAPTAPPAPARVDAAAVAAAYAEVQRLRRAGQTDAALRAVERHVATYPGDARLRFAWAVLLAQSGQAARSEQVLRAMTADFPDLAEPHNNLAVQYAAAGRHGEALRELEEALRLDPGYPAALENLGDVHVALAIAAYGQALRRDPHGTSVPPKLALARELVQWPAADGAGSAPGRSPGTSGTSRTSARPAPGTVTGTASGTVPRAGLRATPRAAATGARPAPDPVPRAEAAADAASASRVP